MARLSHVIAAVVVGGFLMAIATFATTATAATQITCPITNLASCTGGAQSGGQSAHGWLITQGSTQGAERSAESGGCAGCSWQLLPVCVANSGQAGPGGEHCFGQYVNCPEVEDRVDLYFAAKPADPLQQIATYCVDPTKPLMTDADTVAPDVRRYVTGLAVTKPTITSWPPHGITLVHLPTYFAANAEGSGQATVGGDGYSLRLAVAPQSYAWSWGDGSATITTDAGAAPPAGTVRHTYPSAGTDDVTVTVSYGATYDVVTPYGTFGPETVAGGPVRTLPAALGLQVRQATAGLTS